MSLNATNIPLEVDVYNVIKPYLNSDLQKRDLIKLDFYFNVSAYNGGAFIRAIVPNGKRLSKKSMILEKRRTDDLLKELCKKFNIPLHHCCSLEFNLSPAELPVFKVGLYPYVNSQSELDTKKSRRDVITIN